MSKTQAVQLPFAFGPNFLRDHAGQLMSDPSVAILELIANSYDAGARSVSISWPTEYGREFKVQDDGTGMTRTEFEHRWRTLSYNRVEEQGSEVEFPPGVSGLTRKAFGRNGKGRLAGLCFADAYQVTSKKGGWQLDAEVSLAPNSKMPFACRVLQEDRVNGHGTTISAKADKNLLSPDHLVQLIGTKFAVDPHFAVIVNGKPVTLNSIETKHSVQVSIPGLGKVAVHRIDSASQDRTIKMRGITWWVNNRMVGEPSWEGLDGEGRYLDGRTTEAKKYSYVVEADLLKDEVKSDWTGFHSTDKVERVKEAVHSFVERSLIELLSGFRKEEKKRAIERNREYIKELPHLSKLVLGKFVDEVQQICPHLSTRDLSRTVEIYAKLEQAKSGYDLLKQLAACSPEDLDGWNRLMQNWTASTAEIVLNEIEKRIKLIKELQKLVRTKGADELHELHPLFERGLWIFGPEYEGIEYRSNRGMAEVVHNFLGKKGVAVSRRRPDIVALPDSSIGFYAASNYDSNGEVIGTCKVLIVELKKGGFRLRQAELDQARDYAIELQTTGAVQRSTRIECWVLGAEMGQELERTTKGEHLIVYPAIYDTILNRAQARLFHLQERIEDALQEKFIDPEVEEVLSTKTIGDLVDEQALSATPAQR